MILTRYLVVKVKKLRPILHPVERESDVVFHFKECEKLGNPVLQLDEVSFKYSKESPLIFQNICIGCRSDSRICIVGPFVHRLGVHD